MCNKVAEYSNLLMQKMPMQRMTAAIISAMNRTAANASSVYTRSHTVGHVSRTVLVISHATTSHIRHIGEHDSVSVRHAAIFHSMFKSMKSVCPSATSVD